MLMKKMIVCWLLIQWTIEWCLKTTFAGSGKMNSVDFSPDGSMILTGSQSGKVMIWNAFTLQILFVYDFGNPVHTAKFSKDQVWMAVGGASDNVEIFDVSTKTKIHTINTGHNQVDEVDFSYNNARILTCGNDDYGRVWRMSDYGQVTSVNVYHRALSCKYGDTGEFVVSDSNGDSYTYSWSGSRYLRYYPYSEAHDSDFRPGSTYFIAVNTNNNAYEFYAPSYSSTFQTFTQASDELLTTSYATDASYFITAGKQGKIFMYNATNRNNTISAILYDGSTSSLISSKFSYDSNYLLVGNQDGTVYYYSRFCHGCPVGMYKNESMCRLCSQLMAGCAICKNSTVCYGCNGGYYLSGETCASCDVIEGCATCNSSSNCSACVQGFYLNGLVCSSCKLFIEGCLQCNSTDCFSCDRSYYLLNGDCIKCTTIPRCIACNDSDYCLECVIGYYQSLGQCVDCPENCKACQSSTKCTDCVGGYYPNSGACLRCSVEGCIFCNGTDYCWDCVEGKYASGGGCLGCSHPCSTCNTSSHCFSCVSGFYISSLGVCSDCPSPCASCLTSVSCISCDIGFYLDAVTCRSCSSLDANCRECLNTSCLACEIGYYVNSAGLCDDCSVIGNCSVCSNDSVCEHCEVGFYSTSLSFNDSCAQCEQGCTQCEDSTLCTECGVEFYLQSNDCYRCGSGCKTCSSATVCLSCGEGDYLASTTCNRCNVIANCVSCHNGSYCTSCELSYYLSSPTTCSSCALPCITCDGGGCLSCQLGFYLVGSSCVACSGGCAECSQADNCSSCVVGYYYDNLTCLQCNISGCDSCNGSQCLSCRSGYYYDSGTCLQCSSAITYCFRCDSASVCRLCDYGYIPTSTSSICTSCATLITGCQNCISSVQCETCLMGFYPNGANCDRCSVGCYSCLDSSTCEVCIRTYTLQGGSCLLCEDNMEGCRTCSDTSTCTQCVLGYYLSGSSCVLCSLAMTGCSGCSGSSTCFLCESYYYLDSSTECKLCSEANVGCQICPSSSSCQECHVGYYLHSDWLCYGCDLDSGCLVCNSSSICLNCKAGYYLSSDACTECTSGYGNCILCSQTQCLQCEAGYYLNGGGCVACVGEGCQLCDEDNSTICLSCNSRYYLNQSQCWTCHELISDCEECYANQTCTECASGYHINSNDTCTICSQTLVGCRICSSSDCLDCQANYFLNGTTCSFCNDYLIGCAFCVSESVCLSCQNGYYVENQTCISCTNITGCMHCHNSTQCLHCQESYYLKADMTCELCSVISGCYACSSATMCISCQGHFELVGGSCIEIEGQVLRDYHELKLISEYVNQTTLSHKLYSVKDKYVAVEQNWQTETLLSLVNEDYSQTQLTIIDVEWSTNLDCLTFYTNNPLNIGGEESSMPFIPNRLLMDSSLPLKQVFKIQITENAIHQILPTLDHLGDLYLDYPLSSAQFYKSFIENQSYIFYLFGVGVSVVLSVFFIIKFFVMGSHLEDRAQIMGHILALKCGALAIYPTYLQYIDYCYGFMTLDLPWLNYIFAGVLSNPSDISPSPYTIYYLTISLSSTYLLAIISITALALWLGFIGVVCKSIRKSCDRFRQIIYNAFMMNIVLHSCLCLQGCMLNPIEQFSVSILFYIVGIVIYAGILLQIIYSIIMASRMERDGHELYQNYARVITKIRLFAKGTFLSLLHLNPLYLFVVICVVDVLISIVLWKIFWKEYEYASKLQLMQHILCDLALGILLFLASAKLGMLLVTIIVCLVFVFEVIRFCVEHNNALKLQKLEENNQVEEEKSEGEKVGFTFNQTEIDEKYKDMMEPQKIQTPAKRFRRKRQQQVENKSQTFIFADV